MSSFGDESGDGLHFRDLDLHLVPNTILPICDLERIVGYFLSAEETTPQFLGLDITFICSDEVEDGYYKGDCYYTSWSEPRTWNVRIYWEYGPREWIEGLSAIYTESTSYYVNMWECRLSNVMDERPATLATDIQSEILPELNGMLGTSGYVAIQCATCGDKTYFKPGYVRCAYDCGRYMCEMCGKKTPVGFICNTYDCKKERRRMVADTVAVIGRGSGPIKDIPWELWHHHIIPHSATRFSMFLL